MSCHSLSLLELVKIEIEHLFTLRVIFHLVDHSAMWLTAFCILAVRGLLSLPVAKMATSSAYIEMCVSAGMLSGRSLVYSRNSMGDITDPCGTPCWKQVLLLVAL